MLLALTLACFPASPAETGDTAFFEGETSLSGVQATCDRDSDTWSVVVETNGWTSGGLLSMSADGRRVEAHSLSSTEASPRGAWDRLELELDIVADPRDLKEGTNTAWLCADEPELAWRVVVFDPLTREKADCATWGTPLDWNAVAGYSACAEWISR